MRLRNLNWRRFGKRILIPSLQFIILIAITYLILFPLIWMFAYSIRGNNEFYQVPPTLIPPHIKLDNYASVFDKMPFGLYFRNSIFVALGSTFFSATFASMGGYALSRFKFLGKRAFTTVLIFSQMMPVAVYLIPLFIYWNVLGLYDTLQGLVIIYTVITLAFSTLLFRSYFNRIPKELDEAAYIDGANKIQTFFQIILPLSGSAIVTVAIYTFTLVWEEFLLAVTLTVSTEVHTLPFGLMNFFGNYDIDWSGIMAASFLISAPAVVIFLILNRYFVRGMTSGAVKG